MLKKLQRRFMLIALFALASLTIVQTIGVNVINIYQRDSDIRSVLKIIAANKGVLPNNFDDEYDFGALLNPFGEYRINIETPYSTRYFVVEMMDNVITKISTEHAEEVDEKTAFSYASQIYNSAPGFGMIDFYRYYYTVTSSGKAMMVFIDMTRDLAQVAALATISVFVNIVTITALVILVYWLSKKAMKPVADSIEKQKQFITDASHELKTPLAIISANAEVLEMCDGENEWLASIKNQTTRMNHLVKKLVELTKLNEMQDDHSRSTFNISEALLETAANFETSAAVANKHFSYSAANDIHYYGNEAEIRQLITILCDNAIKYTDECGHIKLSLYKSGKSIIIESYNTCEYVDPNTVSRLFDRFYRGDSSRAREEKTGGYGIGLSIAQAIVHRHKGKIKVSTTGTTGITFKVTL
ncbi:MAG: HAMP domain-containing histidine kinase [Clostridia bacterium]|nr:HAMP domain-containing histidine kinase [Clostridia bacterium]